MGEQAPHHFPTSLPLGTKRVPSFGGSGEVGIWVWPYLAILVLCGSNGLLDVEDVAAGPDQLGGARVQDGLTATLTGHNRTHEW